MTLDATIYGPLRALHSGHYGNWAPNPAVMAANLVSEMRDDDGNILIPDFSYGVRPLTATEMAAIAALPPVETGLKREYGFGRTEGGEGLSASTLRPAINVRGFRSGKIGVEAKGAIPTEAQVSFDLRLVPGQSPEAVRRSVEAFLTTKNWTIVSDTPDLAMRLAHPRLIRLEWQLGYGAFRTDMDLPVSRAVIAAATRAAGRKVVVLPMLGGSDPLVIFNRVLKTPLIGLPIVNHDDSQHAPNENLWLQNLWVGIETYASMMADLYW